MIIKYIIAILLFSAIILFHELGHFLLAKANGIRVNEFSLGLGPTIVGFTKGETKYSIKLLPFGGACMMEGEDGDSDDGALNNAELLAVILRTGSVGENSLELASRLLAIESLSGLVSMTVAQLTKIRGIGKVKAIQLQCIGELSRRLSVSRQQGIVLDSPQAVGNYYMNRLKDERQEQVLLVFLNNKGALIRDLVLTKGTVNQTILSPREVFIEAFRYQAVKIILIHNHPSGDPTPSAEDVAVTRQIQKAGELTAIPLLDHIIIGDGRFISLKERGYIS